MLKGLKNILKKVKIFHNVFNMVYRKIRSAGVDSENVEL